MMTRRPRSRTRAHHAPGLLGTATPSQDAGHQRRAITDPPRLRTTRPVVPLRLMRRPDGRMVVALPDAAPPATLAPDAGHVRRPRVPRLMRRPDGRMVVALPDAGSHLRDTPTLAPGQPDPLTDDRDRD